MRAQSPGKASVAGPWTLSPGPSFAGLSTLDSRLCRSGYTLLELLLVLTVLLVAATVVWPSVERLRDQHQLNQSVEEIRGQLAQVRLRAIDTGIVYEFRYERTGRSYQIGPAETVAMADSQDSGSAPSQTATGQLPEGLRFTDVEGQNVVSGPTNEASGMLSGDAAGWSAPLLFQPDGSAGDAAFEVTDSEQRSIRISVRGLTGAVTVGPMERRAER